MYPQMRLDDFAEVNPRVTLKKGKVYPYVEMATVTPGDRYVTAQENRAYKSGGARFEDGDTLFARITPCLENGKIAQYRGEVETTGFGSTEFFVFRYREGVSDPAYIFYLALTDIIRKPAEKSMTGASGRQRADLQTVKDVNVPAPPLPTQRRIAAILSAYDDLIENNTRRIALLERMAQLLYREWFVRFRFPGHEDVEMVASELGEIPAGWEVRRLGSIAEEVRRNVKPEDIDPATPYIGLGHMPKESVIALPDWGAAKETKSTKRVFKAGEILFGKIRPYFHKVGVAPVSGVASTDAIIIVPKKSKYFSIVLGCVSSKEFVDHATQSSTGTKMPRANWKVLVKYPVPIPPEPLFTQYQNIVEDAVALVRSLVLHNRVLRRARDLLLPRLISGEVDVSNLKVNTGEAYD